MKFQIVVYTQVGNFTSKAQEVSQEEMEELKAYIKSSLSYLSLDTESGTVFFKEEILNNSAIALIEVK